MIVTVFFFFSFLCLYMFPHLKRWIKKKKTQAVAWQSRKSTIVRILFFFFFVVHAITEPR